METAGWLVVYSERSVPFPLLWDRHLQLQMHVSLRVHESSIPKSPGMTSPLEPFPHSDPDTSQAQGRKHGSQALEDAAPRRRLLSTHQTLHHAKRSPGFGTDEGTDGRMALFSFAPYTINSVVLLRKNHLHKLNVFQGLGEVPHTKTARHLGGGDHTQTNQLLALSSPRKASLRPRKGLNHLPWQ